MSLKLLGDTLAIIPLDDPVYREESGLWLADQSQQRVDQGIVKYRGPASIDVRVGDHVFFSSYCGTKITVEGEGILIIMSETDIDAMWEEPPKPMFPRKVVNRLLEESKGEIMIKAEFQQKAIDYVFEILSSKFDDYERERGLEF